MDIVTFLEFDGNPPAAVDSREPLTLGGLRDRYFATHGNGSLEQSTIDGMKVH